MGGWEHGRVRHVGADRTNKEEKKKLVRNGDKKNIKEKTDKRKAWQLDKCCGDLRRSLGGAEWGWREEPHLKCTCYLDGMGGLGGWREGGDDCFFVICHSTKNVHGNYKQTSQ